jgi:hypothetical protein
VFRLVGVRRPILTVSVAKWIPLVPGVADRVATLSLVLRKYPAPDHSFPYGAGNGEREVIQMRGMSMFPAALIVLGVSCCLSPANP